MSIILDMQSPIGELTDSVTLLRKQLSTMEHKSMGSNLARATAQFGVDSDIYCSLLMLKWLVKGCQ